MKPVTVTVAEKLVPLLTKRKRLKIAVGGRGATKSIGIGDAFLKWAADGEQLCGAREFQSSIDDSVHRLLQARIQALGAEGFHVAAKSIQHESGGSIIYKGLARNIQAIRSLYGIKRIWLEEGQTLSDETIEVLLPTIREGDSEVIITMNRGSSKDPVAQRFLKRHEKDLARVGYYEDDEILIVQINWRDNPWFPKVLQEERLRDFEQLPRARYDHIWEGAYSDTVANAIILPEWFDACIDAHVKLGFAPQGAEVVAHDPADSGDAKALAYRHGSVIVDVQERTFGDVNEACDWATDYAIDVKADEFHWDTDGMGVSLKRQIADALKGKKVALAPFSGASSPDRPDQQYDPIDGEVKKAKTNAETFKNKRAQYYWALRDRCYKTYQAVTKGKYLPPDELISFSSAIKVMDELRAEVCRIPRKDNGSGRIQILTKAEMKAMGIDSPNMADALMMALAGGYVKRAAVQVDTSIPVAHSAFRSQSVRLSHGR